VNLGNIEIIEDLPKGSHGATITNGVLLQKVGSYLMNSLCGRVMV